MQLLVADRLRLSRRAAGITQESVGHAIGLSQKQVSRIELAAASLDVVRLSAIASVVGLDLVVNLYPGGVPIRDTAHYRLFDRLQALLPSMFLWNSEVPMPIRGDQRAIDAMIVEPKVSVGFELETRLLSAEEICRRVSLKQRDADLAAMVLVLSATLANRNAVRAARSTLRGTFPLEAREVLAALRAGRAPRSNGIIFA